MSSQPPPTRRRWLQFNTTTLFLVLLVAAALAFAAREHIERLRSEGSDHRSVKVLAVCDDADDLVKFYGVNSLSKPDVQEVAGLTLVQAFPYSGVDASWLYVYSSDQDGSLQLVDFVRVPSQRRVVANANADHDVAISADSVELLVVRNALASASSTGDPLFELEAQPTRDH